MKVESNNNGETEENVKSIHFVEMNSMENLMTMPKSPN